MVVHDALARRGHHLGGGRHVPVRVVMVIIVAIFCESGGLG
jgi:hypothetical protein